MNENTSGNASALTDLAADKMPAATMPRNPLALPAPETLAAFAPVGREIENRGIVGFRDGHAKARPFHMLRAQVLSLCEEHNWTNLGIVSAAPGAGKSFVAANLAAALSRKPGLDVYLVDCDLRRPAVASGFGLTLTGGLETFLDGSAGLAEIGRRVEGTSLVLFAATQRRVRSAELLAQPNFEAMIRATAADPTRKVVIFDLPPVFAGDDALIVLKLLDAYIHVVNAGETGRRQFEQAQKTMASTPCAGTVLNQYQGGLFDPYGYGGYGDPYQKYYSFEDQSAQSA